MKATDFLLSICLLMLISACGNKKSKYQLDAKYVIEREMKGINFGIYVMSENAADSTMKIVMKVNAVNKSNILEFGIASQEAYLQRIYYFSYQVENDIWIEQDGVKISCSGAVFERNYNLTKDITLTMHFENVNVKEKKTLVYYPQPFDLTPIKFKLK